MKDCRRYSRQLHMLAQDELDDKKTHEILDHVADCEECSKKLEEFRQMRELIEESLADVLIAPDISDSLPRLASEAPKKGRSRGRARRFLKKALIGATACVVIIVLAGYLFFRIYFGRDFPADINDKIMRCSAGITLIDSKGKSIPLKLAHHIKKGQRIITPELGRSIVSFNGIRILSRGRSEIGINGSRDISLVTGNIAVAVVPRKKPCTITLGKSSITTDRATLKLSLNEERTAVDCISGFATLKSVKDKRQKLAAGQRGMLEAERIIVSKAKVEDPFEFMRTGVIQRIKERFARVMSKYVPYYQTTWRTGSSFHGPEIFGIWDQPNQMYRFASYTPASSVKLVSAGSTAIHEYYESLFVPSNRMITIGRQKVVPLPPGTMPTFPRWSYDGSMITFMESPAFTYTGRACVVRLDDLENPWSISQEYDGAVRSMFGSTWAADNRHVVFQVETGPNWDEEGPTGNFQIKIAPVDPAEGPLRDFDPPFYDIPLPLPLPVGKNISPSFAKLPWGDALMVSNWGNLAYVAAEEDGQAVKGAPGMFLTDFDPLECFVMGGGFSPSGSMLHLTGVRDLNFNNMNVYILYDVEDILDGFTPPPRSFDDPRIKRVAPTKNMQFTGGFSYDESLNFVHEDVNNAFNAAMPTNIFGCDFDIFYVNALPGEPGMPTQIHAPGNQMFLVPSPEGNRIAYCNYDGSDAELRVVSFDIEADINVDLGGVLIDNSGTSLIVPPGTLEENFTVKITTPFTIEEEAEVQQGENTFFAMRLIDAEGLENPKFIEPMTLTIRYTDEEVFGLDEWALDLYYYDESDPDNPVWVPLGGTVDPENNEITVEIQHFSKFSVGGEVIDNSRSTRQMVRPSREKQEEYRSAFRKKAKTNTETIDTSTIIVEEGVGFDPIFVHDPRCTSETIKSFLGEPERATSRTMSYEKRHGLFFRLKSPGGQVDEIQFQPGFKGKLKSGISLLSSMDDVFATYGEPLAEKKVDRVINFGEDRTLYREKGFISKIVYREQGLLFIFISGRVYVFAVRHKASDGIPEG